MTKKIAILGGGIAGLTVAHELLQYGKSKYDIHVYERHQIIGGMARSSYKERHGAKLPTEYCWRIYGPNYDNLREILKQIPLKDNPANTVHDNLIDIHDYIIADQKILFKMNNNPFTLLALRKALKHVPWRQKWQVLNKILYCFMISDNRLNQLDSMTWKEYIDPHNDLCHDLRKYIVDIMGPYLGADLEVVNVPSVAKTLESFKVLNRPISVMRAPTNEAWFDHWKHLLEENGVKFHFDSQIIDIKADGDTVKSALLSNGIEIHADEFFCCLPVESVARMPSVRFPGINELAKRAYQLMVGIQLYFDKKITLSTKNTAIYLPNSPWQLVIEPQGSIWGKTYADIYDVWSIGLCDSNRLGDLTGKPFVNCSPDEIKNEVWHQINNSELNNHLSLNNIAILDYNLWDTYIFNGQKLETCEPKFSTNKGTFYLRPDNQTEYKNFYFASAYTKTDTDMFEMESAAESGRRAAQILEKNVRVVRIDRPLVFTFYRWLDTYMPRVNMYQYAPVVFYILGSPLLLLLPFVYVTRLLKRTLAKDPVSSLN